MHRGQDDGADEEDPLPAGRVDVVVRAGGEAQGGGVVDAEGGGDDDVPDDLVAAAEIVVEPGQHEEQGRLLPDVEEVAPG